MSQIIRRKCDQIASSLYRTFVFPFVRIGIELRTHSVLKQKTYINQGTVLAGKNYLGKNTYLSNVKLGFGSYVSDRGMLKNTIIGKYTSIGTDVSCISGKHPICEHVAMHPAFFSTGAELGYTYSSKNSFEEFVFLDEKEKIQIRIGNDVWIGNGVKIMEGITIGDGAVIGAASLVTKDVEPYGIYAGTPAKKIKSRFNKEEIDFLTRFCWWNKGEDFIKANIEKFHSIECFMAENGK